MPIMILPAPSKPPILDELVDIARFLEMNPAPVAPKDARKRLQFHARMTIAVGYDVDVIHDGPAIIIHRLPDGSATPFGIPQNGLLMPSWSGIPSWTENLHEASAYGGWRWPWNVAEIQPVSFNRSGNQHGGHAEATVFRGTPENAAKGVEAEGDVIEASGRTPARALVLAKLKAIIADIRRVQG